MKWSMVVLIGMVAAGISFASVGRSSPPVKPVVSMPELLQDHAALPEVRIQDMSLTAQAGSAVGWHVFAKQAALSETEQHAVLHQVEVRIFRGGTEVWHLAAARAHLDSATGDMTVEGQVRLRHRDGYTIETARLRWHTDERRLETTAAVKLHSDSVSITGTGLQSRVDQHRITMQHGVRATFRLVGAR